jgi:hypothetical protein
MSKEKQIRITIDLTSRLYDRLGKVEDLVGAGSKAEVVREALRVYEYLVSHAARGSEFRVIEKGSRESKPLAVFTDVDAAELAAGSP